MLISFPGTLRCFPATRKGRGEQLPQRLYSVKILKYFLPGPLQKNMLILLLLLLFFKSLTISKDDAMICYAIFVYMSFYA